MSTTLFQLFARVRRALAVATPALILVACGGGGGGATSSPDPPPPVTGNPPPPAVTAPTITRQPSSQSIIDGQSASFTVAATGTAPLSYQWKRNGADILGATATTYTISSASLADDAAQFSVVVTNAGGSATSNPSSLTVTGIAPSIVTQPVAQAVLVGGTAMFSVTATGSQPLQYQWRINGAPIAGATGSSYVTGARALSDSGTLYDVRVSNAAGAVASAGAELTVNDVVIPPSIITQPASASARAGGAVAFAVVAAGTAPLHYVWSRNDVVIPNQNDPRLLIVASVSGLNDQDRYSVTVSNSAGSVISSTATLSVTAQTGGMDLVAGLYGGQGNVDGSGANAHFQFPSDVAADSSGNLFITDYTTVRKMTPAGVVTTIAGNAAESGYVDASGANARFNSLHSIAVDGTGNVFVADNNAIRRIAPNGSVTTLAGNPGESGYADGTGTTARFDLAGLLASGELAVAPNGDIYVGDCGNHVIRRITPAGVVSTYAGVPQQAGSSNGPTSTATFNCPSALGFDDQGNNLYVSDSGNHTIRRIAAGTVSTLAGTPSPFWNVLDGTGGAVYFQDVIDLAVDGNGIVSLIDFREIRTITPSGVVTTVAGTCCSSSYDGVGTAAGFLMPLGIGVDSANNLYVADTYVYAIRKITPGYVVSTLPQRLGQNGYQGFADGSAGTAQFNIPVGITADVSGNIYVADSGNCAIRTVSAGNIVTTLVGEPNEGLGACSSDPVLHSPLGISTAADGNLYVGMGAVPYVAQVTPSGQVSLLAGSPIDHGFADGVGQDARFSDITGVAADGNGNVYVADSNNNTIRKINIASRTVSTLAGNPHEPAGSVDGIGSAARFTHPCGIEADPIGNVYVAECETHAIRKITPAGVVTTLAGTAGISGYVDGAAAGSLFNYPADVSLDDDGNLYVVDQGNFLIRKITPAGVVSTVAGTKGLRGQTLGSLPGSLNTPVGIHARAAGGGNVELLVTIDEGVVRITTPR